MKYGIKYIQQSKWDASCALKTERGYEAWISTHGGYTLLWAAALTYENINDAYRAMQGFYPKSHPAWYYVVEEIQ